MDSGNRELLVRPYHWETADKASVYGHLQIRCYSLDENNLTHLLRIESFPNIVYVELPLSYCQRPINWNQEKVRSLHATIKKALGDDLHDYNPHHYTTKQTLYHLKVDKNLGSTREILEKLARKEHVTFPMLQLGLKTRSSVYALQRLLKTPLRIADGRDIQFNLWEAEIDPIIKLLAYQDIHHCSWITGKVDKVCEKYKISDIDQEYFIDWITIKEVKTSLETHPMIAGFDIEAYSDKHRKFPEKLTPEHDAICVAVTIARDGAKKTERTRFLIVQGDINKIPKERFENTVTVRVTDQYGIVQWMAYLINSYRANVVLSYNGMVFDYDYLDARLSIHGYQWPRIGFLKNERMRVDKPKGWESAAYGVNRDVSVNMPGVLNFDMYKIVKRDFKLPEYKLGKVGLFFKLGTKDDITPEFMFKSYEKMLSAIQDDKLEFLTKELGNLPIAAPVAYRIYQAFTMEDQQLKHEILNTIDRKVAELCQNGDFISRLKDIVSKAIENGFNEKEYAEAVEDMTKVAIYCIQDVELCFDLYEHFKLWIASIETANIVGVNMIDLYYRGQQIRCLSQLYRSAMKKNIVLDIKPVMQIPFVGGKVIDPEVGLWDDVMVLDFKSLYPLLMIAYNICYTTYVPENLWHIIPEEWCNIIKVNCNEELDPSIDEMDIDEEDMEEIKREGKHFCNGKKGQYEFRYIKAEILKGLLPELVGKLVDSRDKIVDMFKVGKPNYDPSLNKESGQGLVLDKRQLGLKISANSFFGFLGVLNNGKRPFRQGAISITAWGRQSIEKVLDYVKTTYNAQIIYGDTDSCMIRLPDYVKKPEDCDYWMERLSKEITDLFPKPMTMKPEYAARMLALMKKKYIMMPMLPAKKFRYKPDGTLEEGGQFVLEENGKFKIETKGVLSARRDNCEWACEVFDNIAYSIMLRREFLDIIHYLIDQLINLISGNVDFENFIITRSLRDNYKSKTYFMKVFSDVLVKLQTPAQPGERLPYLVYVNPEGKNMGERMMLRDRYVNELDSENPPKIDYLYYVDKILTSPVDQLIAAGFSKEIRYLHDVKFRRTTRCKYIGMDKPVTMAVQIMATNGNLEDLRQSIVNGMDGFDPTQDYFEPPQKTLYTSDEMMQMLMEQKIREHQEMEENKKILRDEYGWAMSPIISDYNENDYIYI